MKIALDVDGVLADFGTAFNRIIRTVYGKYSIPLDYVPKDWYWTDVLTMDQVKAGFKEISITNNFWSTLQPFKEELDTAYEISCHPGVDMYLLTSRAPSAGGTIVEQTRYWLQKHVYASAECLAGIITVAKPELKRQVLEGMGIEAMIDDHGPTVEGFDMIPGFQGYLFDRPWNQDAKVRNRVSSVKEFGERIGCLKVQTPKISSEAKKFQSLNSQQSA